MSKTFAVIFSEKKIQFTISSDFQGSIHLDPDRFLRVLVNIAANASDALFPGGHFDVTISRGTGSVLFTLRDDGPGIPISIQDTLFEPFVTSGKSHGTGLGMAIAKSLVEVHGGTIGFESVAGKGVTFKIEIPDLNHRA